MAGMAMNKRTFEALGKVFAAEVEGRLPFQSRLNVYRELLHDGLVEWARAPGVSGYSLTQRGHLLYCEACDGAAGDSGDTGEPA